MKTRIITALMVMFLFVASASAGVKDISDVQKPSAAAKLLEKRIKMPYLARELKVDGYVAFELKATENNTVEFFQISANSSLLSDSVQEQIKELESSLCKVIEPGKPQLFKINFQNL